MEIKLRFILVLLLLSAISDNFVNCDVDVEDVSDEVVTENEPLLLNTQNSDIENSDSNPSQTTESADNEDVKTDSEYDDEYSDNEKENDNSNPESVNEEEYCSVDYFINKLVPDDYEEGKSLSMTRNVKHINETIGRLNRVKNITITSLNRISPFLKQLGSRASDIIFQIDLEPECLSAVLKIADGIRKGELWALKFFDSTANFMPSGFLDGIFSSYGEFDECLDIQSPKSEVKRRNTIDFGGKYCLLKPILPMPSYESFKVGERRLNFSIEWMQNLFKDNIISTIIEGFDFANRTIIRLGICIPSICTPQEIEAAINQVFFPKFRIPFELGPDCATKDTKQPLDKYQYISLIILATLLALVIISSISELCYNKSLNNYQISEHNNGKNKNQIKNNCDNCLKQILTSFSILKNTKSLFVLDIDKRYEPIDTLRLFMTLWIFIQNTYVWTSMNGNIVLKRVISDGPYKLLNDRKYFFIRLPQLIETLFLISGLVLALNFGKHGKKFKYFSFILKRWLRLTPAIMGSMLLIYLTPHFGDGPLWNLSSHILVEPCKINWMPTIGYYSNFNGNIEKICNITTVYLSTAFQLYIIAPIIMIPLMRLKPKKVLF